MRKPCQLGDPCPKCNKPVRDPYKPGRRICHACGLIERRAEQAAARVAGAKYCSRCEQMLRGSDKRLGACKPCREAMNEEKNAARRCPCGRSIAHRTRHAKQCENCSSRSRSKAMKRGNATMKARVAVVPEAVRPVAQAWPGLRGPGGEWEHGVTTVQGWATLDGTRV